LSFNCNEISHDVLGDHLRDGGPPNGDGQIPEARFAVTEWLSWGQWGASVGIAATSWPIG